MCTALNDETYFSNSYIFLFLKVVKNRNILRNNKIGIELSFLKYDYTNLSNTLVVQLCYETHLALTGHQSVNLIVDTLNCLDSILMAFVICSKVWKKLFDSFKMTPNNKYYVINEPRFLRETKIVLALLHWQSH